MKKRIKVLAGDHKYLVWHAKQLDKQRMLARGGKVLEVSSDSWPETLAPSMWGKVEERLVFIQGDPGPSLLGAQAEKTWVIVELGGGKLPAWTKELSSRMVEVYPRPKPWEEEKTAIEFVRATAKEKGLKIDPQYAALVVRLVGLDLGVLAFEIQKLEMWLGGGEVQISHIAQLSRDLGKPRKGEDVVQALGLKSAERLTKSLQRALRGTYGAPPLKLLGLLKVVLHTWMMSSLWLGRGLGGDEVAKKVGMHPYRYKLQVAPYLLHWDTPGIQELMKDLGEVEHGCKTGHIAPRTALESVLLRHVL